VDLPIKELKAGAKIAFAAYLKSADGKPLTAGSIGIHTEFLSGVDNLGEILARTDALGTSTFIGRQLGKTYRKYSTSHKVRDNDVPAGLAAVKGLRFVVVALQSPERDKSEKPGAAVMDDVSVKIE
tara:strand:+ start:3616 stop:3993 length:378 start_codon:yes stop_codon:yes gene_type:complete